MARWCTACGVWWRGRPPGPRWGACLVVIAAVGLARTGREATSEPFDGVDMPTILGYLEAAGPAEMAGWFGGRWVQQNPYYRPVVSLSFWFDYRVAGLRPAWWRWHNAVIVTVALLLAAAVVREMSGSDLAGLLAGLLGLDSEPMVTIVYFVAPRTDALCVLFLLAAVLASWKWGREPSRRRAAAAMLALATAADGKEFTPAAAVFLPLAAWAAGAGGRRAARAWAATGLLLAAYWMVRAAALGHPVLQPSYDVTPFEPASMLLAWRDLAIPPLRGAMFYETLRPIHFLVGSTWRIVAIDLVWCVALWSAARRRPRPVVVWLAWILSTSLLSAPFARIALHYWFAPDLGNGALLGLGLSALLEPGARRVDERCTSDVD